MLHTISIAMNFKYGEDEIILCASVTISLYTAQLLFFKFQYKNDAL
jgi:hypothetical protein